MYLLLCLAVFALAYLLNILTISVGYHRGLAHGAVTLHPGLRRLVVATGSWITGLDPKAWVVMHRMHHAFADTPDDPHSPKNVGLIGIGLEQLRSYERTLRGLNKGDPRYTAHAYGLDFELNWLNRTKRWYLPYLLHTAIAAALLAGGFGLLGLAYLLGIMSHPVQGGLVNALGHAVGGRNFDTEDDSTNNLLVAWLVFGEGLQNNHHQHPRSANFAYRAWEPDLGYLACRGLDAVGLLSVDRAELIPPAPRRTEVQGPA